MRKTCFGLFLMAVLAWPAEKVLPLRWVYISRGLTSDRHVEEIREIAKTAHENGLNGVLFAAGLDSIDLKPPEYLARLQKVKEIFREYQLEMVPNVFSAGYGGGILAHDKNLAEGLPVKDAIYVVKDNEARIEPEIPVADGGPAVEGIWTREIAVKPYRCYRSLLPGQERRPAPYPAVQRRRLPPGCPHRGQAQPDPLERPGSLQYRLERDPLGLQQHVVRQGDHFDRRAQAPHRQSLGG